MFTVIEILFFILSFVGTCDSFLGLYIFFFFFLFQIAVGGTNVQAYQIAAPSSLAQGVVMTSGSPISSPQHMSEEGSRKRELRLLKNRYAVFILKYLYEWLKFTNFYINLVGLKGKLQLYVTDRKYCGGNSICVGNLEKLPGAKILSDLTVDNPYLC